MFILVGRWGERGKRENVCWMQQRKVNNSLYAQEGFWVWGLDWGGGVHDDPGQNQEISLRKWQESLTLIWQRGRESG